jgi:hypothetical protein
MARTIICVRLLVKIMINVRLTFLNISV